MIDIIIVTILLQNIILVCVFLYFLEFEVYAPAVTPIIDNGITAHAPQKSSLFDIFIK